MTANAAQKAGRFTAPAAALAATITLALAAGSAFADEASKRVGFPQGYAQTFTNYLSLDRVGDNTDQIIRLFANDIALEAARAGAPLPDGSIVVGEIYKAKKDADGKVVESSLGRRIRDKFAAVAVMEKGKAWGEALPEKLRNGDWDFAIFSPDGKRLEGKNIDGCRACHAPLGETEHMFSLEHLRAAAK